MAEPITNDGKTPKPWQFQPGNPGGPGRPKGSRHKLQEAFLKALADDFEENGIAAICLMREKDPAAYARVVASLLAKESNVDITHHEGESVNDAQARNMAQEFLERAARTEGVGKGQLTVVHDSAET